MYLLARARLRNRKKCIAICKNQVHAHFQMNIYLILEIKFLKGHLISIQLKIYKKGC